MVGKEKMTIMVLIQGKKNKKEEEMKKMKCLLVLALGVMLILGSFGILNGQEHYNLRAAGEDHHGVQQIKNSINPGIQRAVAKLRNVLRALERMDRGDIPKYVTGTVIDDFVNTCFREQVGPPAGEPILKDAAGTVVARGWLNICNEFWDYQHPAGGGIHPIVVERTDVFMDFKAYDTVHNPTIDQDTDAVIDVQTTLTGSPNPLFVLYGASEHRRSCDPYP